LTAKPFAKAARALTHALALASVAFLLFVTVAPAADSGPSAVVPAAFTPVITMKRQEFRFASQPALTHDLLAAYVERRKALQAFDGFEIRRGAPELTEALLSSYIAGRRNKALDAIDTIDTTTRPALTAAVLSDYAEAAFTPTVKLVKMAESEKLCLAQAIYHEARGESHEGQLAVANVIINRAMNKRYPSTICGVVFQNADLGRYKCQFTFACDGRSDLGGERAAWERSMALAESAFYAYKRGERPGVVPNSVLFYHTTAVAPNWSRAFRRVAAIGSHIFYAN
jgi:spore germination cell wall hydrolase CwlJ-like protein